MIGDGSTVTPEEVGALAARGETLHVEFKDDADDGQLVEAVACLANGGGGTVLVGVEDDGTIVGARPRHGATTDPRRVEALIANRTRPAVAARAELVIVQGRNVLVIHVPAVTIPTATSSGQYLRRTLGGDGRPACVPFFVFETSGHGLAQDPSVAVVVGATWDDIDPLEIERFRRFVREGGERGDRTLVGLSDEDLCRAIGGLDANGHVRGVRRLALLLFGREQALRTLLPTHEVAWQVLEGQKVLENEFTRQPLLRMFEALTQRFRARNRSTELVDLFRTQIPDYSEDAFREALANALVHRDWTLLGGVHVQWTETGIRLASPGGFPEGVRLDNLLVTPPRPRNPLLADAFKRAGIVERTGRGIDTIYYEQIRYGRPMPRYTTTQTSVTVELPGGAANQEFVRWVVSEGRAGRAWGLADLLVLRACAEQRRITVEEAAAELQSDVTRARAVVARLVDGGMLEARGERKGRTYHLSATAYRVLGDKAAYVHAHGFEPLQQEQMVLQFAQTHGQITRREAMDLCKLSGPQATRLLARVAEAHPELRLHGEKRGARYIWTGPAKQARRKK